MRKEKIMKRSLSIVLFAALSLVSCSNDNQGESSSSKGEGKNIIAAQQTGLRSVPVRQAMQLMQSKKGMLLLDVRTEQEQRMNGTIEGAYLVPIWAIMQNKLNLPLETPIMLFCAVGGRSYWADQLLVRHGYKEVYNLEGGIDAWKKAGLPLK